MNCPPHNATNVGLPIAAAKLLVLAQEKTPRVHALTSPVAQGLTANLALASGAIPSLSASSDEIAGFVNTAHALLINLGMMDPERRASIPIAIKTAQTFKKPWVLDPVFVSSSPERLAFARQLITERPNLLRCNGQEFHALSGTAPDPINVRDFARDNAIVVAVTGKTDFVSDGTRLAIIDNGHPHMARVTAMGCAGGVLSAAFLAVEPDTFVASTSSLLVLGIAGEQAGRMNSGPGSFPAAYLDALFALDTSTIETTAKVIVS